VWILAHDFSDDFGLQTLFDKVFAVHNGCFLEPTQCFGAIFVALPDVALVCMEARFFILASLGRFVVFSSLATSGEGDFCRTHCIAHLSFFFLLLSLFLSM